MNWKVGLFRLWVIGSILWVIYVIHRDGWYVWESLAHLGEPNDPFRGYQPPPRSAFRSAIPRVSLLTFSSLRSAIP
jgi:hypothetical protein